MPKKAVSGLGNVTKLNSLKYSVFAPRRSCENSSRHWHILNCSLNKCFISYVKPFKTLNLHADLVRQYFDEKVSFRVIKLGIFHCYLLKSFVLKLDAPFRSYVVLKLWAFEAFWACKAFRAIEAFWTSLNEITPQSLDSPNAWSPLYFLLFN